MELIDQKDSSPLVPFVGLQNIGNTCYLNSVLQVLLYCPGFIHALKKAKAVLQDICDADKEKLSDENFIQNFNIVKELDLLFSDMHDVQKKIWLKLEQQNDGEMSRYIRPTSFFEHLQKRYPLFEAYTQQDAQECLHYILNACSYSATNSSQAKACSPRQTLKMYGGQRISNGSVKTSTTQSSMTSDALTSKSTALLEEKPVHKSLSTSVVSVGCLKQLKRKGIFSSNASQADKENICLETGSVDCSVEPPPKKLCAPRSISVHQFSQKLASRGPKLTGIKNLLKKRKYKVLTKIPEKQTQTFRSLHSNNKNSMKASNLICYKNGDIKKSSKWDKSIKQLFYGQTSTTLKCFECENTTERSESFKDVSLPVKPCEQIGFNSNAQEVEKRDENVSCSLSWALSQYTAEDILDGNNKYYCSFCSRLTEGGQSMKLKQLPPVMTFHLKRFLTTADSCNDFQTTVSKITSSFKIPRHIDLYEWCTDSCNTKYELFAIIIHKGATISGGHYLSYVKHRTDTDGITTYDDRWLEMDDEDVHVLDNDCFQHVLNGDLDSTVSRSPYLLFYHQV